MPAGVFRSWRSCLPWLTAALASALMLGGVARADEPAPNVEFPSDGRMLKGWVFRPGKPSETGTHPAVLWNHGSDPEVHVPPALVRTYTERGFVVFLPVRRYHRPSTGRETIMELINAARDRPQKWIDLNEEENRDVFAALDWLTKQPAVDPRRIVVSGVSFGGVQTLLAAERGGGFRAAVAFAPGAISWGDGTGRINRRLETAVQNRKLPLFLLQARNDYSLGPVEVLGPLLGRVKLLHRAELYPAFGTRTPGMSDEAWHALGHGRFATRGGDVWGADVVAFVEEAFRLGG